MCRDINTDTSHGTEDGQKRTKSAKGNHNSKIAEDFHRLTVTPDKVPTKSGPTAVAGV